MPSRVSRAFTTAAWLVVNVAVALSLMSYANTFLVRKGIHLHDFTRFRQRTYGFPSPVVHIASMDIANKPRSSNRGV